jgi:hypothetical protein
MAMAQGMGVRPDIAANLLASYRGGVMAGVAKKREGEAHDIDPHGPDRGPGIPPD